MLPNQIVNAQKEEAPLLSIGVFTAKRKLVNPSRTIPIDSSQAQKAT